jgi:hypothetical protein
MTAQDRVFGALGFRVDDCTRPGVWGFRVQGPVLLISDLRPEDLGVRVLVVRV